MVLIIAEKPSLGRNIAAGIGRFQSRKGYLEGENHIITWAFGHLFELSDIEYYQGKDPGSRWTMEGLPCFPEDFHFELRRDRDRRPDEGVRTQFELIRSLCNRPDVDTVVNAGDADREGEIIVRLCIRHALETQKPVKRLWLPDQTPQTVAKALGEMEDDSAYDLLAGEGYARTYIDWLYGVNLTRYATLRCGPLLRVGRVIVPIVRAIYERDMAIRNFIPGHYLALVSSAETHGETVELTSKKKYEEKETAEAEAVCRQYNGTGAVVTDVKKKKDTLYPGKLYSLSKLQNVLGKKYKMSMQDSLKIIQGLYEKGFLTYPRTNSEYLATAEKDKIRQILENVKKLGYPVAFRQDKNVFDDSKIESHSALTPTYKIPDKNHLTEEERKVYGTVFRRFVAVFCAEKCVVSKTEITIDVGDLETFVLKGTVMLEPGWTKYDDRPSKDKFLPKLEKGEPVNVDFRPVEKETTPPRHYTIETLNNYLKNPFKEEKAAARETQEGDESGDDAEDYRAIFEGLELGTEATRTGIIDNARKSGYIALTKDVYTILPGGEFLVESLDRMKISMDKYKTSELGQALKKVFHGTMTVEQSVKMAEEQITEMFRQASASADIGNFGDVIGSCPLCGRDVVRRSMSYGCSGYRDNGCSFRVSTVICGRPISVAEMQVLLRDGRTGELEGFISKKTGKPFKAALQLEEGKAVFSFADSKKGSAPTVPRHPADRTTGAVCPRCGRPVLRGRTAYGCSGFREGCEFRLPLRYQDHEITAEESVLLLNGGTVSLGDGRQLRLDPDACRLTETD